MGTAKAAPVSAFPWIRWLSALVFGVTLGTGAFLADGVRRAETIVARWLAAPPRDPLGAVWSAPAPWVVGREVDASAIVEDLVASGFDRGTADGMPATGPSVRYDGARLDVDPGDGHAVTVQVADGRVIAVSPPGAALPPILLARTGDPDRQRAPLPPDRAGRWVVQALLASEDVRFRRHGGVDPLGIARAIGIMASGGNVQGGSTLSQQLAKNLFVGPDRSVTRKVREALYAIALERTLDKDAILGLYLGEVYLGSAGGRPLFGVDAAARAWFGVDAADLSPAQAATLVGTIPSPAVWSPWVDPAAAKERRDVVLRRMRSVGALDDGALATALAEPLRLAPQSPSRMRRAPYAVAAVLDDVRDRVGAEALERGGLDVDTTIDPLLQGVVERAVASGMSALIASNPEVADAQAAAVVLDARTGDVRALVGGRSWSASPFDRAVKGQRQPGSAVKPFAVLLALSNGAASPSTSVDDAPIEVDGWHPGNADGRFAGTMTLRRALERSRNPPFVGLAGQLGRNALRDLLRSAGLTGASSRPSTVLGAFETTPLALAAASTAWRDGIARAPRMLLRVRRGDDALAEVPVSSVAIASKAAGATLTHMLQGVVARGTAAASGPWPEPVPAGKTGTTTGGRDAWMVGASPDLTVAVWVGRDVGELGLSGATAALPIWGAILRAAGPPTSRFVDPGPTHAICPLTGLLPGPGCPPPASELGSADGVATCGGHAAEDPG